MGKSIRDYRNENGEVLKFFDDYPSPPPPVPRTDKTVLVGLNTPVAPLIPRTRALNPNSSKQRLKRRLFEDQKGLCAYCDEPLKFEVSSLDHIKAKSKGGTNRKTNFALTCFPCNSMKGDISSVEEANERVFRFTEFIARLAARGYLK